MDIVNLEPGGVIIDHKTGEIGLLMRRYDIVEHIPLTLDLISDNEDGLADLFITLLSDLKSIAKNRGFKIVKPVGADD